MKPQEAIEVLKQYAKWRVHDNSEVKMPHPSDITEAINVAISDMKNTQKAIEWISKLQKEHGYFGRDNWVVLKREFKIE